MGMWPSHKSSSCFDKSNTQLQVIKDGNPDPNNYVIIRVYQTLTLKGCVLLIKYPDCHNYEGKKILVFDKPLEDITKQKLIDPHFCDNKNYISPIARFEPTARGWALATNLLTSL